MRLVSLAASRARETGTYKLLLLTADDRLLDLLCERWGTRSSIEVCPVRRGGGLSTDLRGCCVSFGSAVLNDEFDKHCFLNSMKPSIAWCCLTKVAVDERKRK